MSEAPGAPVAAADLDATPSAPAPPLATIAAGGAAVAALAPVSQQGARQRAPVARALGARAPAARSPEPSPAARPPAAAPTDPPAWDTPDDVRALSLRLRTLDDDALAWDEPAEAFGAPAPASLDATPGVQAVRAGAPARARVLDSPIQR